MWLRGAHVRDEPRIVHGAADARAPPKTVQNFTDLATGGREWTDPRDGETKRESL